MLKRVKGGLWLGCSMALLLSTACSSMIPRLGSSDDLTIDPDATGVAVTLAQPTPPSVVGGRQVVQVRKGAIAEVLTFNGRVGGRDEVALTFPARSKVVNVLVKAGQVVEQGQVLVEADSRDIASDLASARTRLETSTLRLEYARMDAENRSRDGVTRAQLDGARYQGAIVDAQANLQKAQADYERVKAGASPSERQSAEAAVAQAQATVDRAQADFNTISAGPTASELREAEQRVTAAGLALQKAEADRNKLKAADPAQVRQAEQEVAIAQASFDRAKGELDKLTAGPDQFEIRAAEREVQQAQAALAAAQSSKEGNVPTAQRNLGDAQDRLVRAKQGPDKADVDVARATVQAAQLALDSARARLETIRKGPDKLSVDAAEAAVESAQITFDAAQARFETLQNGSPQDRIDTAQGLLDRANSALTVATVRLRELNSRPTAAELRDADGRVAAAQAALDRARLEANTNAANAALGTSEGLDLALLQRTMDQDQADVSSLQKALDSARLLAPVSGVVSSLSVRPNESVEAGRTVLAIAPTGEAVIRAPITDDREADRLKAGQSARVQLDGMEGELNATLLNLIDVPNAGGRIAQLQVKWSEALKPTFGGTATTNILVQEKQDVLIVPQKAVRTAGPRRYVEFLEGTARRVANVELGIGTGKDVEILSGLREGQSVLVAP